MFDICAHDLSAIFWRRLLRLQAWNTVSIVIAMRALGVKAESDRPIMNYQTGSIPLATAVWLAMLSAHLKPRAIVEIGTFIGKSTAALAWGINAGELWTCDKDNPAPRILMSALRDERPRVQVHEFEGKTSTQLLEQMAPEVNDLNGVDLFFWDGRVMPEDLEPMARLTHGGTVFAFDDFEGTEKGVANIAQFPRKSYALITPPAPELLEPFGVVDRSTLALLVPAQLFRFTAQ